MKRLKKTMTMKSKKKPSKYLTNEQSVDTDKAIHDTDIDTEYHRDVPKIDSGVRMLCMDGGGAKGVIEATILDKIFITIAATLKYKCHIVNWVTLVLDKKVNDADKLDTTIEYIQACILSALNKFSAEKLYKKVQLLDRTKELTDKKHCIVISGLINMSDEFVPLTTLQKKAVLDDVTLKKVPGLEIKDFLHGAAKYWVFLDSDQTDETRKQINADIMPVFEPDDKTKKVGCLKLLVPASCLFLDQISTNTSRFENKDLLIFYWDQPVKTIRSNTIRDQLLGKTDGEPFVKYNPELFIEELLASDLFDLLIGTSTGSILAFGMGYKGLSPQECRDVYLESIGNIFSSKYDKSTTGKIGLGETLFRTIGDLVGQGHYSIDGVIDTLEENYNKGRPTRTVMGGGEHRHDVICACVALDWEKQALETFDTHNENYKDWDLIQFLTASSAAPVYFTTPFTVRSPSGEGTDYIDGGLGANCPAVQGIDLAKVRWKGENIELILSLGAGIDKLPPALPATGGDWLKTLCCMATDGDSVWDRFVLPLLEVDEACKSTEKLRIQPKMELAAFSADSTKVIEMCNLAEDWLNTCEGFSQVLEASGMIIAKSMKLEVESRILTEQDLLNWLGQALPIGKSLFKSRAKHSTTPDMAQSFTNTVTLSSGSSPITMPRLYLSPNSKLRIRFPAIDRHFLYIPKPISVGQTDLRFTVKFDYDRPGYFTDTSKQMVLKLHCPDNHEVRIICNLDLYDPEEVFKISNLVTVPLEETEQFHRLVHEASKEISELQDADRVSAEEKLCSAMKLLDLPEYFNIRERYVEEHFMRIQAYFYLWKNTVEEVSLKALNETLIKVGMKKRQWPMRGKLGVPDVTVRTMIPAPPENMMLSIAAEYFQDRKAKARAKGDEDSEKRYSELMKHLGSHPAKKEAEAAKYKRKFFDTVFKSKRKEHEEHNTHTQHTILIESIDE